MKLTTIALLAGAGLATAQNLEGLPTCAVPCLQSAIASSGCAANDQGCQCAPGAKAAISTAATGCLIDSCSVTDLAAAAKAGDALCVAYSSALSSTGAPSTSGSSGSTTSATTTSATSSETSTVTAVTTSLPSPTSGSATTGGSSTSRAASSAASSSGSAASVGSTSSAAGAAPTLVAGIGSFVGIVAGLVAAL